MRRRQLADVHEPRLANERHQQGVVVAGPDDLNVEAGMHPFVSNIEGSNKPVRWLSSNTSVSRPSTIRSDCRHLCVDCARRVCQSRRHFSVLPRSVR